MDAVQPAKRIAFEDTKEFIAVADDVFRGLVMGGGMGNVINGHNLDREELNAYQAGVRAYEATEGKTAPALLAMALNARLGGAKQPFFAKLQELGVNKEDVECLLFKDGEVVNYRMLWDASVAEMLVASFQTMSETARVAVLAHTLQIIQMVADPADPAPPHIRANIRQTAQSLLEVAKVAQVPLADTLQQNLLAARL